MCRQPAVLCCAVLFWQAKLSTSPPHVRRVRDKFLRQASSAKPNKTKRTHSIVSTPPICLNVINRNYLTKLIRKQTNDRTAAA